MNTTTTTTNIFEQATRDKVRFSSRAGELTVEDVWTLPLATTNALRVSLDTLALGLHTELEHTMISFVSPKKEAGDTLLQLKLDIVKHIIQVRLAELETAAKARDTREKRDKLLEIIGNKEAEALTNLSLDELRTMVAAL